MRGAAGGYLLAGAALLWLARGRAAGRRVVIEGNAWPLTAELVQLERAGPWRTVAVRPRGLPVTIAWSETASGLPRKAARIAGAGPKPDGWTGDWPPPLAHATSWWAQWRSAGRPVVMEGS